MRREGVTLPVSPGAGACRLLRTRIDAGKVSSLTTVRRWLSGSCCRTARVGSDPALVLRLDRLVEAGTTRGETVVHGARGSCAAASKNPKAELRHRWVPYERISIHLKRAVITSEDARFSEHEGVDWEAIEKAYEDNVKKRGRPAKGGSTITQQLAKNLFLSPDRSYRAQGPGTRHHLHDRGALGQASHPRGLPERGRVGRRCCSAQKRPRGTTTGSRPRSLAPSSRHASRPTCPNPKRYGRVRSGPYLDSRTANIARYMPDAIVP